jgi:competence ComEA-like helix-hairpin-helix protein
MKHDARALTGTRRSMMAAALVLGSALTLTARIDQSPAASATTVQEGNTAGSAVDDEKLAEAGEAMTERVCTECHGMDDIFVMRRSVRGWQNVMTDMVGRGVVATPDELKLVRTYLTRYFGLVSVNSAPAEELSAVLGLTAREAAAVVEHRKAHGKFGDLDALSKATGLDKATLEPEADALLFE